MINAESFSVGDRYVNNIGRILTITSVTGTGPDGIIGYDYDPDEFISSPRPGRRAASRTEGWERLQR